MNKKYTIFCDIDGTLLHHQGTLEEMMELPPEILPNVLSKFDEWSDKNYNIILTTGRPEYMRERTIEHLDKVGINHYSQLIMDCEAYARVLINDEKPWMETTAIAYNIKRNGGLGRVDI